MGNKLRLNPINEAASKFDVSRLTMSRICNRAKERREKTSLCRCFG